MNRTEPESYQEFESLPARVAGVVRSPRALFAHVVERPRWAPVMLLTFLVSASCGVVFMQSEVGRQALVDQWERTALAFGQDVSDQRYASFLDMSEHATSYAVLTALTAGPGLSVLVATLIYMFFGSQRRATFAQVLAVVVHAGVILTFRQLLMTPLNYARETMSSPTTLSQVFPVFDETSAPARFLGAIDIFVVWWVIALAVGAAVLYRRPARATIAAFMGAYVGFAVLLAIAMAVTGGSV